MSMTHTPFVIPPPKDRVAELMRENESLKAQIRELKVDLMREQERSSEALAGAQSLRTALQPLYNALQHVFGDLDSMGVGTAPSVESSVSKPRASAAWESWKEKLGGQAAKAIDALLLHGALTQTQLGIHIGCAKGSVPGIVYQLNKASLINKNGGKISLKEL
jgi:hypothetical protein